MKTTKPVYRPTDFKRDFTLGDVGLDVHKLQDILQFYGYEVSASELGGKDPSKAIFGESTMGACEALRANLVMHPPVADKSLFEIILQYVFQITPDELNPAYGRGTREKIRNYRDDESYKIDALEVHNLTPAHSLPRVVELASKFLGQREKGGNHGALVRKFCGQECQAWCGGFVNYVMDRAVAPGLFDQQNPLAALGYRAEAMKYGVFRDKKENYLPSAGDVIVFSRGNGKGHVGIIVDREPDGTATYISGNDGDAVRATKFNINHPPAGFLGYADTAALAGAKGVNLNLAAADEAKGVASAATQQAKWHKASTYHRG